MRGIRGKKCQRGKLKQVAQGHDSCPKNGSICVNRLLIFSEEKEGGQEADGKVTLRLPSDEKKKRRVHGPSNLS